ncbi:bacteriocin [Lactobacillus sp.]|uniref:bacteriocin n=1 Tax=Lactobacillus sp. TaxID=1591 RepID=UPI0019CEAFD4|nr:bacteriocin [Lactobacillus sp.]MBD5430621.1 bacteriocin [Lactobacillus sp.]
MKNINNNDLKEIYGGANSTFIDPTINFAVINNTNKNSIINRIRKIFKFKK